MKKITIKKILICSILSLSALTTSIILPKKFTYATMINNVENFTPIENFEPTHFILCIFETDEFNKVSFGLKPAIDDATNENAFKKFEQKSLNIKAINDATNVTVKAKANYNSNEKAFLFNMNCDELMNGNYNFQVFNGNEPVYFFKNVNIKKSGII